MYKLKYLVLIFALITFSFLICAEAPQTQTSQYDFQLESNIPENHKIKIIKHNHGSLFVSGTQKNNGDIIVCSRFANLDIKVSPDDNYEIDKIIYNKEDITSSLNDDIITLHSINKDGTIEFKFKMINKIPANKKDSNNNIPKIILNRISQTTTDLINFIKTGDSKILILIALPLLAVSCLIYIHKYLIKK